MSQSNTGIVPFRHIAQRNQQNGSTRQPRTKGTPQPVVKEVAGLSDSIQRAVYEKYGGEIQGVSEQEILLTLAADGVINPRVVKRPADRQHALTTTWRSLVGAGVFEKMADKRNRLVFQLSQTAYNEQRRKQKERDRIKERNAQERRDRRAQERRAS